jgi:ribonuclease P protein component
MERWLSLTVSAGLPAKNSSPAPYFISIPKKLVRQAVRRNRIRRVLREALKGRVLAGGKRHLFKVVRPPKDVGLAMAERAIDELLG